VIEVVMKLLVMVALALALTDSGDTVLTLRGLHR
jgi:hypothetical protein